MKLAYYIKNESLGPDTGVRSLLETLSAEGFSHYRARCVEDVEDGTDALLSLGGDGTFLNASALAVRCALPVLGVNFGRLGFLSDADPADVVRILAPGGSRIERRSLLELKASCPLPDSWPCALNEISVSRVGASMLGIDVHVGTTPLPTYWADGLLVATSSGSTAYSLSVGGPICTPDTGVFIIAPISPHNLNVRPLIVPQTVTVAISLRSRDCEAVLTLDNRSYTVGSGLELEVRLADKCLERICPAESNFFNALRSRLLWGADVRNSPDVLHE